MTIAEREWYDLLGIEEHRLQRTKESRSMKVRIRYIDKEMPKLEHIGGNKKSTWIDVRASRVKINGEWVDWQEGVVQQLAVDTETGDTIVESEQPVKQAIGYNAGDYIQVYLGFAMELPEGKEAYTAPRGSTFKNYGLIQTNSWGIIDEAFRGDDDEWFIPFFALRSGVIERYDRVGQFRIVDKMEDVEFLEVEELGNENRGGHGSTGVR